MNTKVCKKCHVEKDLEQFPKRASSKDGHRNECKDCLKEYLRQYNAEHKDQISENKRQYAIENKEKLSEINREWRAANKDKIQENSKQYYLENKEEIIEYQKQYRLENKDKILQDNNQYKKDKYHNDPSYRLRKNISRMINLTLQKEGGGKNKLSCLDFLPYTMQELKDHLEAQFEPWMTWENRGKYDPKTWDDNDPSTWTWNMDHIISQASLPYSSMTDDNFKQCWALSNLRPYSAKQNVLDGSRRSI